jgi:hypothetical protein
MSETHPLHISASQGKGTPASVGRLVKATQLVLVGSVIVRLVVVPAAWPRVYGVGFAMTALVLAPLGLYLAALCRRAITSAGRQLAVGFAVIAAAVTLVGFDRTSMWFMAVTVAVGAGVLTLSWIASDSATSGPLQVGALTLSSAVGAFLVVAALILLVPAWLFQFAYLHGPGAVALAIGPLVVAAVMKGSTLMTCDRATTS